MKQNTEQLTLAFCGFGRTGKDTAADIVREMVRPDVSVRRYKFADKVREECREVCKPLGIDPWTEDPVQKEVIRPHMIDVGAGRREEDPDYWIKALRQQMDADKEPGIRIVTDVRYKNETRWLLEEKAIVVLLHRHGYGPLNSEEQRETSKMYSAAENPFFYRPGFRPYWWTHELDMETSLKNSTKREREKRNMLESIPELQRFTTSGGPAIKLDREYMSYLKSKNIPIPKSLR